ncbi:ABC transporter substrate-binding protein [Streptomyces gamaensis]|uniref:ABC transporter substrate-binding protein n=1 Tax=Streptomyces gamaensis TaxID=1763542 RepID=A0ABW0Z4W1_9ACTN
MRGVSSRPRLSRRGLLAAGGAAGLGALLAACGDGGSKGGGNSSSGGGAWSFKDDRGTLVKAGSRPRRIVGYVGSAAALHDFGIDCVGIYGPSTYKNGSPTPQAGSLDLAKLTVVGNGPGEFSIEKYMSLKPDLLVGNMVQPPAFWQLPEEGADKIFGFAPSVGISAAKASLLTVIERYAALAESLGADVGGGPAAEAKKRFEAAVASLRRAAEGRPGLKVMAAAAQADNFSVGVPGAYPDIRYYRELGVDVIEPTNPGKPGFWENHSWENADAYPADVILLDQRSNNLPLDELRRSKPTWRELPAVKADQVVPWNNEAQFSYAGYAPLIERLATAIGKAQKLH